MWTHSTFLEEAQKVISVFNTWATQLAPHAIADHLCYKCESSVEFEEVRVLFESKGGFIFQSIISGRRIAIIKFAEPILSHLGPIHYLELADQKPDKSQAARFDHVEVFPVNGSMENLVHALEIQGVIFHKTVRPHHTTYDTEIAEGFSVRLEPEALIEKIKREEM